LASGSNLVTTESTKRLACLSKGSPFESAMRVLRRSSSISSLALVTADVSELQTQPIANLFAAGCDVGGFSGHGYVVGLSQALVTGLRAGEEAAKSTQSLVSG